MTTPKTLILLSTIMLIALTACQTNNVKQKTTDDYVIAAKDSTERFPEPIGYLNDFENIFTSDQEITLDSLMEDFDKRTTIQVAVITIDTTYVSADSFDLWTLQLANHWGVGQKDKNNGVVIGISSGLRRIRINNGYGIEKILSDNETQNIMDSIFLPSFRKAEYFEGTYNGLKTLMKILESRYK